jgi:DNA polymerase I
MMPLLSSFSSIWFVVFALPKVPGEPVQPVALAASELCGNQILDFGGSTLQVSNSPPYPVGAHCLIITINAADLAGCHLALGWCMPERIVDLLVEWRCVANGRAAVAVSGLTGALLWYGQSTAGAIGDAVLPDQLRSRLGATKRLFSAMRSSLDLGRALLRGRYLCAVARIERTGIPIDQTALGMLVNDWPNSRSRIIEWVDQPINVYRGQTVNRDAFADWLVLQGIVWPTNFADQPDLSETAFRNMARLHPVVRPLKELQATLDWFDPRKLAVGHDGRNRTQLNPFASRTGRNQPSVKASVFGAAAWVRHLIKPELGTGVALLDWQQQEFGIAAALSGDDAMQRAYQSGDPYLALAVSAGAVPEDATAESHGIARGRFKACALGLQYGMGAARLAQQVGISEADAKELLARHKAAYPKFWRWSDAVETQAVLHGELQSVFGWRVSVGSDANPRGLRNFPMQANGAEMLRLACCLATEAGIQVCATIHDAILIEAPLDQLDDAVRRTKRIMAEASAIVLDGFALRTDVKSVRAPERWIDPRGAAVWSAIECMIRSDGAPAHERHGTCAPTVTRPISYMS